MAYTKGSRIEDSNEYNLKELSDHHDKESLAVDSKTDAKNYNTSAEFDEDDDASDTQCGWGPWKPKWAQFFNNPKGFLFLLSVQGFLQGMIAFGFLYVVITTLEKRFNLSSVSSGTMVGCYDIASMSVVIFVTYFGERGSIPRWVGWGGLIFATGSLSFTLPHFLTGFYDFEVSLHLFRILIYFDLTLK